MSIHNINVGNPDDDIHKEDFKAVKAIAPMELGNMMKAKDRQHQKYRQRQQKRHGRKVFEEQIEKLNNDNGLFVKERHVMVWKGSIIEGEWRDTTQLTPMGKVRQLRQKGKKAVFFHGAIVTFCEKRA